MKISELKPNISVDTIFKVLEKGEPRVTRTGKKVAEALVGDESGVVLMTLWEENIDKLEIGETYVLKDGYTNLFQDTLRLTVGRTGSIEKSEKEIAKVDKENNMSEKKYKRSYVRQFGRRPYGRRSRGRRF